MLSVIHNNHHDYDVMTAFYKIKNKLINNKRNALEKYYNYLDPDVDIY